MRRIEYIVLHCTGTLPTAKREAIERFWREVRGWKNPGYHYLVDAGGTVHALQPIEKVANGVRGLNHKSVHISYIGGVDASGRPADTRTDAQKEATQRLLDYLLPLVPGAKVAGHYHFAAKACPSFDVPRWLRQIGVPKARIYQNGKEAPVR